MTSLDTYNYVKMLWFYFPMVAWINSGICKVKLIYVLLDIFTYFCRRTELLFHILPHFITPRVYFAKYPKCLIVGRADYSERSTHCFHAHFDIRNILQESEKEVELIHTVSYLLHVLPQRSHLKWYHVHLSLRICTCTCKIFGYTYNNVIKLGNWKREKWWSVLLVDIQHHYDQPQLIE